MREQLKQYIDLLFAGASGAEEIKEEILNNTLERYDDLVAQGKSPQAAYQLSISGIGDISELLHDHSDGNTQKIEQKPAPVQGKENDNGEKTGKRRRSLWNRVLNGIIWGGGLSAFLFISLFTGAWYITWIIIPVLGCCSGIVDALFDIGRATVSAIVRLVVFVLLMSVLAVCSFGMVFKNLVFSESIGGPVSGEYTESSGSVSAADIRDIEIEWVSGSVTIEKADTETISFHEVAYGEDSRPMVWKQSGDKLILHFAEREIQFGVGVFNTVTKDLLIKIPEDWIGDEISIESVSASVFADSLICEKIELDNVSGKCVFTNCGTDELSLETVSGEVDYTGTLTVLDCDSVSGNCVIRPANIPKEIDLNGVSCDLILYLNEDCGFSVDYSTASGDFESDFAVSRKNGKYVYGDGSCRIKTESASGDIEIRKAS